MSIVIRSSKSEIKLILMGIMVASCLKCLTSKSKTKCLNSDYANIWTKTLGKGLNPPLSSKLWVRLYHYWSSTRMALASNNPGGFIYQRMIFVVLTACQSV